MNRSNMGGAANDQLLKGAAYASVGVSIVLLIGKFVAWTATDSVSILATLVDSLLDAAASLLTLCAIKTSLKPADTEHRFGHGKAEALGALGQAAFVAGSAMFLIIESFSRLIAPAPIARIDIGVITMAASSILCFALIGFQMFVIRRTGSIAIRADSLHYRTDLAVAVGVIISLIGIERLGWTLLDPLYALLVAAYILLAMRRMVIESLDVLMDRELSPAHRAQIQAIAAAEPGVLAIEELRTRSSGARQFIQFNIELSANLTLSAAHVVTSRVENAVMRAFPSAEVIVHQEPDGASVLQRRSSAAPS